LRTTLTVRLAQALRHVLRFQIGLLPSLDVCAARLSLGNQDPRIVCHSNGLALIFVRVQLPNGQQPGDGLISSAIPNTLTNFQVCHTNVSEQLPRELHTYVDQGSPLGRERWLHDRSAAYAQRIRYSEVVGTEIVPP
jgi:hypothetical protein